MENERIQLKETKEIELPKLDLKQYIGAEIPIATVEEYEGKYGYYIIIRTDPLDTIKNKDGETRDITASKVF